MLSILRDKLWDLVRWRVQHDAYHSNCDAVVLHGVAKKCSEGLRVLGYSANDPGENRERGYYVTWILNSTNEALHALYWWKVLDCSITKAFPVYQDAADRVKECRTAAGSIESDELVVYPAESE